jgi:nucleoside-diphosphate-sugar epimerase
VPPPPPPPTAGNKLDPLPIFGDGSQVRCFTWIFDVASAVADFSFDPRARNEIFNLANVEPMTMKELALLIQEIAVEMGMLPALDKPLGFHTVKEFKDDVRVRLPSADKARAVLGWEATTKTRESIRACLERHRAVTA